MPRKSTWPPVVSYTDLYSRLKCQGEGQYEGQGEGQDEGQCEGQLKRLLVVTP